MGLTIYMATLLVTVLGFAITSRLIVRFVSLLLSDTGETLFKRLADRYAKWVLAFLIVCTAFDRAKNLGVIV